VDELIDLELPANFETFADVVASFQERVNSQHEVTVVVPIPAIGSSNSHLDISDDFADASFVAERLSRCAQARSLEWARSGHAHVLHINLSGYVPEVIAHELATMAVLLDFSSVEDEALRDEYDAVLDECFDHPGQLATMDLLFPELADLHFVNLVHGGYYEWDADVVAEELEAHPERRYGFFESRAVRPGGRAALCSMDEWIIPGDVELAEAMSQFELEPEAMLPGSMLLVGDFAVFLGDHTIVRVSAKTLLNALACGDDYMRRNGAYEDAAELMEFRGTPLARTSTDAQVLIGEFASRVALRCDGFLLLFLNVMPMPQTERVRSADQLASLEIALRDGEPSRSAIALPWMQIDDEAFEQLCYDYVFAHPEFDKDRIEKIGKSRSRDGGRDIVAWTIADRLQVRPPVKYIFQCKRIGSDASLTPRHLQAIGDTIEKYSAGGYGIMCSGYVDATLHDRIDAITLYRKLSPPRKIDRFQLERFLARRPHLVARYFGPPAQGRR
jgi:hypothetical protein